MGNCLGTSAAVDEEWMLDDKTRIGKGAKEGALLKNDFKIQGGLLGIGRMASVKEALDIGAGQRVAVKACSKKLLSARPARLSRTLEIEALIRVGLAPECAHVVRLLATYEDRQHLYLVMELVKGGDLFHYIAGRDTLSEMDVRHMVQQLLEAIAHCHRRGVVHRDLKPENIMLRETNAPIADCPPIVLVDFGSAAIVHGLPPLQPNSTLEQLHDFMGTAFYCAPEVWSHCYGKEADLWSVGAILYVLLTGRTPSPGLNRATIQSDSVWKQLQSGDVPELPSKVSPAARSLLLALLDPDPKKRMTAEAALQHPWISGSAHVGNAFLEGSVRGIKAYATNQKIRKMVITLLVISLDESRLEAFLTRLHPEESEGISLEGVSVHTAPQSSVSSASEGTRKVREGGAALAALAAAGYQPQGADARAGDLGSNGSSLLLSDICGALESEGMEHLATQMRDVAQTLMTKASRTADSTPLFGAAELASLLRRHVESVRKAPRRDKSWKAGKRTRGNTSSKEFSNRGRSASAAQWFQSGSRINFDANRLPESSSAMSPFAGRKKSDLLVSSASGQDMRHVQSSLELFRAESDKKGVTPSPNARNKVQNSASVHGEQLYRSTFLKLGNES